MWTFMIGMRSRQALEGKVAWRRGYAGKFQRELGLQAHEVSAYMDCNVWVKYVLRAVVFIRLEFRVKE